MKVVFAALALFLLFGCANQTGIVKSDEHANESKNETGLPTVETNKTKTQPTAEKVVKDKIEEKFLDGTKGLLVLSDNYEKPIDFIRFYNKDGSLWYEFTFYYDDSDGKFEYENDDFRPFSFHSDYFTLALKLVDEKAIFYEVVVNEDTKLKKYVKKADKNLKFETWEQHILHTFAIDFNELENPVRETPNGKIKKDDFSNIDRFAAADIKENG